MTPQEIWNCFKTTWLGRESEPTMEERISKRVNDLMLTTKGAISELCQRNESVDATYIRTVTLALSENLDKRDAFINDRYNRLEASWAQTETDLRNQLDASFRNNAILHDRLDALIRKLRAGLE